MHLYILCVEYRMHQTCRAHRRTGDFLHEIIIVISNIHRNESTNFAPAGLTIIKPRCRETKRCGRTTALSILNYNVGFASIRAYAYIL